MNVFGINAKLFGARNATLAYKFMNSRPKVSKHDPLQYISISEKECGRGGVVSPPMSIGFPYISFAFESFIFHQDCYSETF